MKRFWTVWALMGAAVSVSAAGCGSGAAGSSAGPSALATINHQPVTQQDLNNFVAGTEFMQGTKFSSTTAEKKLELKAVVAQMAVRQWVLSHHLTTTKAAAKEAQTILKTNIEGQVGSSAALGRLLANVHLTKSGLVQYLTYQVVDEAAFQKSTKGVKAPTSAQEHAYYTANKSQFATPPQDQISEILVKSQALADALLAKAKSGSSFASLAKQYSLAASGKSGGSLGFESANSTTMGPSLYQAVSKLKAGDYATYHGAKGYYVVWVQATKPASYQTFTQVKSQIAATVTQTLDSQAYQSFVKKLEAADHIHYSRKS